MVDKELIENWRNVLKPSISSWLFKTNYEGMGEQDKEEFGRDFDEILDLALIGLEYKAQLSQKRTDKRTETRACDLISRQAAIDAVEKYDFDFPQYMERFVTELRDAMKEDLKGDIADLPSAQPIIIKCKDCKNSPLKTWFSCPLAHLPFDGERWCWKGERDG